MDDDEQRASLMEYAVKCGFNPKWLEKTKSNTQQDKQMQQYCEALLQQPSVGEAADDRGSLPSQEAQEDGESDASQTAANVRGKKRPRNQDS